MTTYCEVCGQEIVLKVPLHGEGFCPECGRVLPDYLKHLSLFTPVGKSTQTPVVRDGEVFGQYSRSEQAFIDSWETQQRRNYEINSEHGFEDGDHNVGEKIALMHSELSEALEAFRKDDPDSEKISGFSHSEEEFADCVIRIMNTAQRYGLRIAEAMIAKQKFNNTREFKHGGKKF